MGEPPWHGKARNGDLADILRLPDLANLSNRRVSAETWRTVRSAAIQRESPNPNDHLATEAAELFLSLLGMRQRLAELASPA
ncbi:MAG: hypothetical protein U0894_07220 [Pirellulales bacterium]